METVQINSPRFNYQATQPVRSRTLNDMRMVRGVSATEGSFSFKAMKPVLLSALVVAAIAGGAIGLHRYSENTTEKTTSAASDPSVPAASQVPATSAAPVEPAAPTAKDSPAVDPLTPMTKAEESSSMPKPGQANNHSSESLNPVKAKEAAKPAARISTAPVTPIEVAPTPAPIMATEITPPAREATPPSPAAPPVKEEPIVPATAPIVEPTPTTPPEPPKQ